MFESHSEVLSVKHGHNFARTQYRRAARRAARRISARPSSERIKFRPISLCIDAHFKFRCRFTIRCNTISRNYMRMTTIIHNYIHGHQCQACADRYVRRRDRTRTTRLGARSVYWEFGTLLSRPAASDLYSARAVDL